MSKIREVTAIDENHAWVSATNGVHRTQDGGATWTELTDPNDFTNYGSLHFFDGSNGWSRNEGAVYFTTDGGETWTPRFHAPEGTSLGAMSFVDMNTGWVADWYGSLYRTTDGGASWTTLPFPGGSTSQLQMIDAQSGWLRVVNSSGKKLLATGDGGETWEERFMAGEGASISDFHALDMDRAWVALYNNSGSDAAIARTTDGGETWETTVIGGQFLGKVHFVDATHGFAGGSPFWITMDGGATWTAEATPAIPGGPYKYNGVSDLYFVNPNHGWIVGDAGNFLSGGMGYILRRTVTAE